MPDDATRVYGVDFSAAETDAGERTWIASGVADGDGGLRVDSVERLVDQAETDAAAAGNPAVRDVALPALSAWIRGLDDDAVVGLDFPFGLPAFVVRATGATSWRSFINEFPESLVGDGGSDGGAGDAEPADPVRAFAERCVDLTERHGEGTYDKRATDAVVGARSPYGFIADTIAFYGIRDVLGAVVDDVRVAPTDLTDGGWRSGAPAGPTLVETYPAAILDRRGLNRTNYKGGGESETTRRRRNAEGLTEEADVTYKSGAGLTEAMVSDAGGDALDAVTACVGAFTAWERDYRTDTAAFDDPGAVALEGYIYA